MNGVSTREHQALDLVDIIDFKWLMGHEGHHVHVERMQSDREYASRCVEQASTSPTEALRRSAARLAQQLSGSV